MPSTLWKSLETIPGLVAPAAIWRTQLGPDFDSFAPFLESAATTDFFSVNRAGHQPPTLPTSLNLRLNLPSLALALGQALSLDAKTAQFGLQNTAQVGSWSAECTPVILTLQSSGDAREFRAVVAEMVARRGPP